MPPWYGLVVLAFCVTACSRGRTDAPAPGASPSASASTTGAPRRSSIHCDVVAPKGWTRSPSPMPDHIAELITSVKGNQPISTLVLEEHSDAFASLGDAVEAEKRRVDNAWSSQHDFGLLGERSIGSKNGASTLLSFRWRRARGEPAWLHYRALFQIDGRWVRAIAETPADTPAADGGKVDAAPEPGGHSKDIEAMLKSLFCEKR